VNPGSGEMKTRIGELDKTWEKIEKKGTFCGDLRKASTLWQVFREYFSLLLGATKAILLLRCSTKASEGFFWLIFRGDLVWG